MKKCACLGGKSEGGTLRGSYGGGLVEDCEVSPSRNPLCLKTFPKILGEDDHE